MTELNILVALPYYPAPGTGSGNAVHGFAKGLNKAGANVLILAEGDREVNSSYEGVNYIKFVKSKSRNPFKVSSDLKTYIKINLSKIDMLILNGIYVPYMYTLSRFCRLINLPYVFIPHSVYSPISFKNSKFKKRLYFNFFEKKVIENALAVQMLAKSQIMDVLKLASPKKCFYSPNGIEIENKELFVIHSSEKKEFIKFIFLGRKEAFMKGLDILIKAFNNYKNHNIQLYIQGSDVGDTKSLRELITSLKMTNVFLLDKYDGPIVEYLSNYDVFIMPSRYEAFSMAVVEAMKAKLPVIASNSVGAADHVKAANSGLLFNSTVEGISNAIQEILNLKSEWAKMGENGYNYVFENLNWEKIANDAIKNYQNLLKNN